MTLAIDILVADKRWAAVRGARAAARAAIEAAAHASRKTLAPLAEVAVHLADDARLKELNGRWRGKDKPTNVLSFPAAPAARLARSPLLGDIVLSYEAVERDRIAEGVTFLDRFRHLVAHGFLHLLGYDHETEADAERMERLERRALASLGVADPYAERGAP